MANYDWPIEYDNDQGVIPLVQLDPRVQTGLKPYLLWGGRDYALPGVVMWFASATECAKEFNARSDHAELFMKWGYVFHGYWRPISLYRAFKLEEARNGPLPESCYITRPKEEAS